MILMSHNCVEDLCQLTVEGAGRRLRSSAIADDATEAVHSAADPAIRPKSTSGFMVPPALRTRLVLTWDFCQMHRCEVPLAPLATCDDADAANDFAVLQQLDAAITRKAPCIPSYICDLHHVVAPNEPSLFLCRQLLRLPPVPLSRMELAFLDSPPPTTGEQAAPTAFGAAGQRSLLRDVHCCMLRLLEVRHLCNCGPESGLRPRKCAGMHRFRQVAA